MVCRAPSGPDAGWQAAIQRSRQDASCFEEGARWQLAHRERNVEPGVGTPKISENNDLAAKPVNPMNCLETGSAVSGRSRLCEEQAWRKRPEKACSKRAVV